MLGCGCADLGAGAPHGATAQPELHSTASQCLVSVACSRVAPATAPPQQQHQPTANTIPQVSTPTICSVSKWSLDKATCSMCNLRFFNQRRLVLDMHYLTLSSMQYWSKSISAEYRQNTGIIVYPRRNAQKLEKFKCMENEKETNLFMKGVYFLTRL